MNKYKLVAVLVLWVLPALNLQADPKYNQKVNKSFDIFGSVFRELTNNYVIELDPEVLVNEGINGMLSSLDPYTNYMSESDSEDLDILSSSTYVGMGVQVGKKDSMLTITGITPGFPAHRAGIRIGDRIYKIDSSITLYDNPDEIKQFTRGKPGQKLNVWFLREGLKDTLKIDIALEEIKVKNVSFSGIIYDSIAYIKLDRFSRLSADEVSRALKELSNQYQLKGVIIDLRDNPGGLLESAVEICELFVGENNTIVTVQGRKIQDRRVYRSQAKPIIPDLPLAVLINNYSASASEVVAGAIQDLDRGIIVGEKSFGKGLVQSVFDLPYKSYLKMTTSKYYTPSGRCIHKINRYGNTQLDTNSSNSSFYTLNKRPVVESKGIIPDTVVKTNGNPDFISELLINNYFFNFATYYSSRFTSLPKDFKVDIAVINEFIEYLKEKNYKFQTQFEKNLSEMKNIAKKEKLNKKIIDELNDLELKYKKDEKPLSERFAKEIAENLEIEILSRFYPESIIIQNNLLRDDNINTAINLLKNENYNKILSVKDLGEKGR